MTIRRNSRRRGEDGRPSQAAVTGAELSDIPDRRSVPCGFAEPALQEEMKRVILARCNPAAFLVDDAFNVLHVHGKLPARMLNESGHPSTNLLRLVAGAPAVVIRAALLTAKSENRAVKRAIQWPVEGGDIAAVIEIQAIKIEPDRRRRYLVLIKLQDEAALSAEGAADVPLPLSAPDERAAAARRSNGEARGAGRGPARVQEEMEVLRREVQAANQELILVNEELRARNRELAVSNDDLSNLLASAEIPILMLDIEGRLRRYTSPAEKAFGVAMSDLGRPLVSLRLQVEVRNLVEILRSVLAGFGPSCHEVSGSSGRSYVLWVRPHRTTRNDIDGVVLSMIDITERRDVIRQLTEIRDYAEAVLDTINDSLLILNRRLKVVRASRSYHALFRSAAADIEGRSIYELDKGRWNRAPLRKHLSVLAAAQTEFSGVELDCEVPKLGVRTLSISGRAVARGGDGALSIVLVIEDVSLRKQAAEAAALRKSEARQRDFVANVSHELLTPITAIKGYAESLIAGALAIPAQRVKFTRIIEKHADRLSQLVEDLLQLSAHDAGRTRAAADRVLLRASIEKLVRSLEPAARMRKVSLAVRIPKDIRVLINRTALAQVMQNLCENAIKYNRRGGRVYIQARKVGRRAVVSVRDTGMGIPRGDLPLIFDRFHRAENARRHTEQGTGLGLSIVRAILAKRGCRVWAESEPGQGAALFFTLPLAENARAGARDAA